MIRRRSRATGVIVPLTARLGADGGGFDVMIGVVLPWFNVMNARLRRA